VADTHEWWRDAVTYQVYIRSFADSDGDGIGDLPGITSRLPYLRDLGVDAVWITPFYPSPQHDHGYDVADYRGVDPMFGELGDADELLATAHELGLKVIVDIVPNHTSSDHEWFKAALAAEPGGLERDRYLFQDEPNNWKSVFGGDAWEQVPDGQWYLHLFDTTQPDLNWRNPEVPAMFEDVLRFWLDRGVDGFRIDVAHGLFKAEGLPDTEHVATEHSDGNIVELPPADEPMWDQPEVHEIYRDWREILDSYEGPRIGVAEAWTSTEEAMARYVRPDELHQAFNFHWLSAPWSAEKFADVITQTFGALDPVGASPTWVLSNHDVVRHPTRYGGGAQGLARARAVTLAMLALPGSAYLYQGEELGLPQVEVAKKDWQDPLSLRTGNVGRDGCRVPIPWSGTEAPFGFGPGSDHPWIPQPPEWGRYSAELQTGDRVSDLAVDGDVLRWRRGNLTVLLNCGATPVPLPEGQVILSSGELDGTQLPPDTSSWMSNDSL
jgi:alpha-glucosidase